MAPCGKQSAIGDMKLAVQGPSGLSQPEL